MKRIRKLDPKRRRDPDPDPLFRAAVADVVPLAAHDRTPRHHPLPKPRPRPRHAHDPLYDELSDHLPYSREPGEPLKFTRPGLQHRAVRRLRGGGSAIEKELDLHGLTIAQARPLLVAFLNACSRNGLRHVCIIHGKGLRSGSGEGVLKGMVASWLSQRSDVLAFHEARPAEGGGGAVVVLLRGMRAER